MDSIKVIVIALLFNLVIGIALLAQSNDGSTDVWQNFFSYHQGRLNTTNTNMSYVPTDSSGNPNVYVSSGSNIILDLVGGLLDIMFFVGKLVSLFFGTMTTFLIPGQAGESLTIIEVVGRYAIGFIMLINNFVLLLEIYKILINKKSW